MPELPEVETAVRELRPALVGKTLQGAWANVPRQLGDMTVRTLARRLRRNRVLAVTRRGKYIVVELERGLLIVHLRMTGRLFVAATERSPHEHLRAGFLLDDGKETLYFKDVRTLGTIRFYPKMEDAAELSKLGWEPLEETISSKVLREVLSSRMQAIKPVLLDQSVWAGVGNIYASEVCWVAGIDPRTSAKRLTQTQCERLCEAVPEVLRQALKRGGSTLRDFMSPDGKYGSYQKEFRVYDREDEPCLRCDGVIQKIVQAQRSTYFCPKCQKKR
ncbi:MAG: bifunctional DNA-formamidopyrimidine glycosylase/DNA-(apurinic or apyrimidinic site) lyase [Calditrichaeota bacterium]|nr:bifunctional DNA-formamidopyrimidine glycosylase/DNA-(apurinic or apyrimidinic site) lyase [Calditrichota bacterium]MCB9391747.1 bifunctional DNA-formamidopyrimidine glycosylase/DNA-(apurinic or apyrimidinic site) lyase [Calditrichota bacterium]